MLLEVSFRLIEASIMLLEVSFTLLEASFMLFIVQGTIVASLTIIIWDRNLFIVQANVHFYTGKFIRCSL
jgi:hypothetical protein